MRDRLRRELHNLLSLFTPTPLRGATYTRSDFRADLFAGVTVSIVLIPQAMALALIAGLPAIFGLYAALPGFIASLWGSSRYLSTGPVAIVSFLTLSSLIPFADPGTPEYIALAALLAFLVGAIQLLMGVFRLGFILQLIPHSAITGFSVAAAAIIIITQIPTLLGYSVASHELVIQSIFETILRIADATPLTLTFGIASLITLLLLRRLPKIFPSALIVILASVAIGFIVDLPSHGVALVAAIPPGLPSFAWPAISVSALFALLPKAAIVALVGFVEAHAIAKSMAQKSGERLDTNQELVGQGLANTVGSFFHGYPVSGSFSRTAINVDAGARTSIAAVVTAIMTVIALLFLTPLFHLLPRAVLAAIVIVSAIPLVDLKKLREINTLSNTDGIIAYTTAAMACILKPDDAIFIGVVLALVLFIRRTAWGTKVFEMGIDREWGVLRGAEDRERVETFRGLLMLRIGMSLYYANALHATREIEQLVQIRIDSDDKPHHVVIDFSGVNFIDITGIEVLSEHVKHLRDKGIKFCAIYMRTSVLNALREAPDLPQMTVLHNITEMKQYCLGREKTLVLGGSMPEIIGKAL